MVGTEKLTTYSNLARLRARQERDQGACRPSDSGRRLLTTQLTRFRANQTYALGGRRVTNARGCCE